MKKARTTYSVVFKHNAANLVFNKGYTIQEACNAVDVGYTAMSRWVAQLKQEHGGITKQEEARPLLEEFRKWLDNAATRVSPKTKLGEAIRYTLNQWEKLIHYIDDGLLSIDNNRAERAVKPFVTGRKNWLFSASTQGAQSSARLYSIIDDYGFCHCKPNIVMSTQSMSFNII